MGRRWKPCIQETEGCWDTREPHGGARAGPGEGPHLPGPQAQAHPMRAARAGDAWLHGGLDSSGLKLETCYPLTLNSTSAGLSSHPEEPCILCFCFQEVLHHATRQSWQVVPHSADWLG